MPDIESLIAANVDALAGRILTQAEAAQIVPAFASFSPAEFRAAGGETAAFRYSVVGGELLVAPAGRLADAERGIDVTLTPGGATYFYGAAAIGAAVSIRDDAYLPELPYKGSLWTLGRTAEELLPLFSRPGREPGIYVLLVETADCIEDIPALDRAVDLLDGLPSGSALVVAGLNPPAASESDRVVVCEVRR